MKSHLQKINDAQTQRRAEALSTPAPDERVNVPGPITTGSIPHEMAAHKHTPGPWKLIPFQDATYTKQTGEQKRRTIFQLKISGRKGERGRCICDAQPINKGVPAEEEDWANARLILSAPDMLEIVRKLWEYHSVGAGAISFTTLMDDDATLGAKVYAVMQRLD